MVLSLHIDGIIVCGIGSSILIGRMDSVHCGLTSDCFTYYCPKTILALEGDCVE